MSGNKVLVVDDNPANLRLVAFVLGRNGFVVETAIDAASTFEAIQRFAPDAVLLDLQLPGMDGYEIARRLKSAAATSGLLIIALTAYAMKGDEERARSAGCDSYITKPIDTRSIPSVVTELLRRHREVRSE